MGLYAGNNSKRPTGDAGRGKHTGKVGWLGGQHRKRGCFGITILRFALTPRQVVQARRTIARYI